MITNMATHLADLKDADFVSHENSTFHVESRLLSFIPSMTATERRRVVWREGRIRTYCPAGQQHNFI